MYGIGTVFTMIGGEVKTARAIRKRRKTRQQVAREYEEISYRNDWPEEDSDEFTLSRESYLNPTVPVAERRTLNESWRERVNAAYQPNHNWDLEPTQQWPQWTEAEKMVPGRHRFDETEVVDAIPISPGGAYTLAGLRALVTQTGEYKAVEPRELVGVGR